MDLVYPISIARSVTKDYAEVERRIEAFSPRQR